MNSPLENRKVHLRGLGGTAVYGVPGTGASATGEHREYSECRSPRPAHSGRTGLSIRVDSRGYTAAGCGLPPVCRYSAKSSGRSLRRMASIVRSTSYSTRTTSDWTEVPSTESTT